VADDPTVAGSGATAAAALGAPARLVPDGREKCIMKSREPADAT
jgi:hypothetical protein